MPVLSPTPRTQSRRRSDLSPFAYTDIKRFLSDVYARRKLENPSFSYGVWARALGIKSPSTLIMLVNGSRNPGPELAERLARYFGFEAEERAYFLDLVNLAKTRDSVQRGLVALRQLEMRNPGRGFRVLELESFRVISEWYFYALKEMTQLADFLEDPAWIRQRLRYSLDEAKIREGLAVLEELGFVVRDKSGRLRPANGHLDTTQDLASEGLKRFHEGTLDNARIALRATRPEEREISGGTFAIKKSDLARAKELIRRFQVQLCELVESPDADEVYQLEVAFFPLTQPGEPKS